MKLITLTLCAAMTSGIVLAQDGSMRDRQRRHRTPDEAISALNLMPEQVTALRENQRAKREASRSVFQAMAELGKQLRAEMALDNPNASAAGQLLVDMKSKREEIKAIGEQFQTQAVGLLDDNQKAALAALEETRQVQPALHQAGALGLTDSGPGQRSGGFGGPGRGGMFGGGMFGGGMFGGGMSGGGSMEGFRGGGQRRFRGRRGPRPGTEDAPTP